PAAEERPPDGPLPSPPDRRARAPAPARARFGFRSDLASREVPHAPRSLPPRRLVPAGRGGAPRLPGRHALVAARPRTDEAAGEPRRPRPPAAVGRRGGRGPGVAVRRCNPDGGRVPDRVPDGRPPGRRSAPHVLAEEGDGRRRVGGAATGD